MDSKFVAMKRTITLLEKYGQKLPEMTQKFYTAAPQRYTRQLHVFVLRVCFVAVRTYVIHYNFPFEAHWASDRVTLYMITSLCLQVE